MKELDKAEQAVSRHVRQWITSETIRRQLRHLPKLPYVHWQPADAWEHRLYISMWAYAEGTC